MRVLALDYGSARCGCAISDPSGTVVTPLDAVAQPATRRGLARLCEIASEREAELVLVGLPLSLLGGDTAQTHETRAFAARLAQRLGDAIPVQMYDERFTTRIAQRLHARPAASRSSPTTRLTRSNEHSRAAAHLLEEWLATRSSRTTPSTRSTRPR